MGLNIIITAAGIGAFLLLLVKLRARLALSRAKHPSLRGHSRISRALAKLVPFYEYADEDVFRCDGAAAEVVARRKAGLAALKQRLDAMSPDSRERTAALEPAVSDMQFTNAYRVPFQFRSFAMRNFRVGAFADATDGVRIRDLDGNWSYDVAGSYGVNLLGYDFYKGCIERGVERVKELGPVLGPYHPVVAENVTMLTEISGLDEVSFHMSGTEAVMQAVRLARYHTRRSQIVLFCGAYHGWWDGVQPGVGNQRSSSDVYTLKEMSERTLEVLRTRKDIACVLVNPLQALHPNAGASSDAMLLTSDRDAGFDRAAYSEWLRALREVCTARGIVLIFDEVFVGFRLGLRGAQGYFGVNADMVTYGKTLGGGLPVGVLCGRADLMKRFRAERPTDICFARGTFNSHPYVMAAMNEFLRFALTDEFANDIDAADTLWNERRLHLNDELSERNLPVRVHNLSSIWILTYTAVSRYNWMFQYYLRAEGLSLSWVGTGRLIFSHNYDDNNFEAVVKRFVKAAETMLADGWWEPVPEASNKTIRRQVLKELITTRFGGRPSTTPGAADQATSTTPSQARRVRRPRPVPGRAERESSDRSAHLSSGKSAT